ncbi:MAG: hypothetical protein KAR39_11635 [Thermoplasmata archaeon]|nr:hypothetical protein [Thermoplasmata archaeon]
MATANVQGQPADEGYSGQAAYDDYISTVVEDVNPVPGGFGTWDAWRVAKCKGAQRLVDDITATTQEIGVKLTTGILLTFSVLNGLLLLSVITAPISMVLQLVITFAAIAVNYVYEDVTSWLISHKESLVCAIYESATTGEAHQRISAYISDNWDVSSSDQPTRQMFNYQTLSSIFDGAMRDYTEWQGDYSEDYCTSCESLPEGVEFTWTFPPCPGDFFQDGGVCDGGRLCFNGDIDDAHQQHINTMGTFLNIEVEIRFRSRFGSGWTVGAFSIDRWDAILEDWIPEAIVSANTSAAAGNLNTIETDFPQSPPLPGGLYRARLEGADGQHDTSPYPLQVEYARVLYEIPPP